MTLTKGHYFSNGQPTDNNGNVFSDFVLVNGHKTEIFGTSTVFYL